MKKTTLALALAVAAVVSTPALAQDYQMEAGASYANINPDNSLLDNDSLLGVDFKYHFQKVSTNNRPLAEAAFLGHNSNVSATYYKVDKADYSVINGAGEVWVDKLYLSAEVTNTDYSASGVDDNTEVGVKVGYMLQDALLVEAGINNSDATDHNPLLHVGAKYVAKLGANFVNLEGTLGSGKDAADDSYTLVGLRGDFFFTNSFSAGLRYTDLSTKDSEAMMGVGARYFFTPMISGGVEYTTQKDVADIILVRVAARF